MENIHEAITKLTGAVNALIEQNKHIERRLVTLEGIATRNEEEHEPTSAPKNEQDLKDISRLPDCVKELQTFDGNPVQYTSWVHSVENILRDYEIVKAKPLYRAILQSIRQKVRGRADAALISYNIFGEDWPPIKKCLSLHYADKRDIRTLEHQLGQLSQKNLSLDEFYASINHQFSLIINKIKTEDYSDETMNALIESHRSRALDIFIRGLNGDLPRMLTIQKPQTLPEAYASCLEIQNLNYRNIPIHRRDFNNTIVAPINQMFPPKPEQFRPRTNQLTTQHRNQAYNIQHQNQYQKDTQRQHQWTPQIQPPPLPTQPKPAVPMEIDRSIQSKQINYMNRPGPSMENKRPPDSHNYPRKQQRLYNMLSQEEDDYENQNSPDDPNDIDDEYEQQQVNEENLELNFMTKASLAYHT